MSILMMVRGVLYVLGGVLHSAAGLPALDHALAKTNVGAQLAQELSIFWVFMGASMVTFGGVQLTRGLRMRKKDRSGSVMALWVAACLILYDVAATIWIREFEPHFLAFVLVGLLMVFAALPGRKAATRWPQTATSCCVLVRISRNDLFQRNSLAFSNKPGELSL